MPGWYIHMEAAKKMTDRLRAGDVPPGFPGGAAAAQTLGQNAYKWRNYLAAGAIGPDIFFMLPDFKGTTGNVLLHLVDWVRDVWEWIDENFMEKWDKWAAPAISGVGDILNSMSGGVLAQLGQALEELAGVIKNAVISLITKLWDWFGLLTSGVPQGFEESAYFWSDMLHYRQTYTFAQKLFENAATDQQRAFALGWMSHCATDVTGHAFVNAKCGGPYRLHWQRHHLIENHMDAHVYNTQHGGVEPYGELGTAALHFRLAFCKRTDAPYNGAEDAPAHDYFTGLPAYDPSLGGDTHRKHLWDLDSGELPDDLCQLIITTMKQVYGDSKDAPRILTDDAAQFRDGNSGRPSVEAIQNTYRTLYQYVKTSSTGGYSPRRPTPPPVFNDHSPPPFPGSDSGVSDDPSRGGEPGDDDSWNLLDLLLALLAWPAYIAQLGAWLLTLPAALLADLLTYPARQLLYEFAVVPMWSLYLAARRPLVMTGFLVPMPEEINRGLIQLGVSPTGSNLNLAAALASPTGTAPSGPLPFDEPSGRNNPASAFGADSAYPRAIIEDDPSGLANALSSLFGDLFCGNPRQPSEFLSPWRYPNTNNAGELNGWEPSLVHPGPFQQGQDAAILMNNDPGNAAARAAYEAAASPDATDAVSNATIPSNQHLGDPVDYSVYLAGQLTRPGEVADFNLDADRGYAYKCWEWDRSADRSHTPTALPDPKYTFGEPCTVPQGFCQPGGPAYNPNLHLAIHYGETADRCGDIREVTPEEIRRAKMPPSGQREG